MKSCVGVFQKSGGFYTGCIYRHVMCMYTNFFSYGNSYWTDMSVCISVSEGDNYFSASETREKMLGFFLLL